MPAGRPSKYEEAFAEQAFKLCLLGHTDKELAQFFEVDEATINRWKHNFPEFRESLLKGKDLADADVAFGMYQRGCGITKTLTTTIETKDGTFTQKREIYIPPDPVGMKWLHNRQSGKWRQKQVEEEKKAETPPVIIHLANMTISNEVPNGGDSAEV